MLLLEKVVSAQCSIPFVPARTFELFFEKNTFSDGFHSRWNFCKQSYSIFSYFSYLIVLKNEVSKPMFFLRNFLHGSKQYFNLSALRTVWRKTSVFWPQKKKVGFDHSGAENKKKLSTGAGGRRCPWKNRNSPSLRKTSRRVEDPSRLSDPISYFKTWASSPLDILLPIFFLIRNWESMPGRQQFKLDIREDFLQAAEKEKRSLAFKKSDWNLKPHSSCS